MMTCYSDEVNVDAGSKTVGKPAHDISCLLLLQLIAESESAGRSHGYGACRLLLAHPSLRKALLDYPARRRTLQKLDVTKLLGTNERLVCGDLSATADK